MKIGILTSGGDCPGLNARHPRRRCSRARRTTISSSSASSDGWRGVVDADFFPLTRHEVKGLSKVGGTILGTSAHEPLRGPARRCGEHRQDAVRPPHRRHHRDRRRGHPRRGRQPSRRTTASTSLGVPKTIDNDLRATDYSFGFDTAVNIATDAMDRLPHDGRLAPALHGRRGDGPPRGLDRAARRHGRGCARDLHPRGADVDRRDHGPGDEGARPRSRTADRRVGGLHARGHGRGLQRQGSWTPFNRPRLGGISEVLAPEIERITGIETRCHGAGPHPARRFAVRPSTASSRRGSACTPRMPSWRARGVRWCPLKRHGHRARSFDEALGELNTVPKYRYEDPSGVTHDNRYLQPLPPLLRSARSGAYKWTSTATATSTTSWATGRSCSDTPIRTSALSSRCPGAPTTAPRRLWRSAGASWCSA